MTIARPRLLLLAVLALGLASPVVQARPAPSGAGAASRKAGDLEQRFRAQLDQAFRSIEEKRYEEGIRLLDEAVLLYPGQSWFFLPSVSIKKAQALSALGRCAESEALLASVALLEVEKVAELQQETAYVVERARANAEQRSCKPPVTPEEGRAAGSDPLHPVWVRVPGGSFLMGSRTGEIDEQEVRRVTVLPFLIMQTEVTVAQYRLCLQAGECAEPGTDDMTCNALHSDREQHPVNCVDWKQAATFCQWAGASLPTEVQWEYAARAGGQEQIYPWGNKAGDCSMAVVDDGRGRLSPGCGKGRTWSVCSRQAGNADVGTGLCDLAGNVWEWVQDCYHSSYEGAPADDRVWAGCDDEDLRVVRGGAWSLPSREARSTNRFWYRSSDENSVLGFRCVRPPHPDRPAGAGSPAAR